MKSFSLKLLIFYLMVFHSLSSDFELRKLPNEINSSLDEFPSTIFDNKLYFIRKDKTSFIPFSFDLRLNKNVNQIEFPKEYFNLKGSFFSFYNFDDELYIIFAGRTKKKIDNDLFILRSKDSKRYLLMPFAYNTQQFESHPQFSKDGKFIIFSFEPPKINQGTDIYVSNYYDGAFTKPKPLDNLNTGANEITPFIDERGDLYFARFDSTDYNIYKAESNGFLSWNTPRKLPYPINTEANEIAPVVYQNKIFFASDRNNPDKNFDIYVANLCLPVFLEVNFKESANLFSSFDKISITDTLGNIIEEEYLGNDTQLIFALQPKQTYKISIKNECTNDEYFEKNVTTLCLDSLYLKYSIPLSITNDLTKEKNIKFFPTGYYRPITKKNLRQLKKLFDYNLIGNDDSTSYIEYPQSLYFDISDTVEQSLNEIVNHIVHFARLYKMGCLPKRKPLKVEVTGFADPRVLSPRARFIEETINDNYLNFYLEKGSPLTNEILSKLRAYYTAKELIEILSRQVGYDFLSDNLRWEILGGGALDEENDYLLLRKVKVKISFEQQEY
ncbi:MAG: TolB family protein [Candidatus Kapaibacteriota bacterium]